MVTVQGDNLKIANDGKLELKGSDEMSVTYTFEDGQESLNTILGVEKIFQMLKGVPYDKAKEILEVALDNLGRTASICRPHLPSYRKE